MPNYRLLGYLAAICTFATISCDNKSHNYGNYTAITSAPPDSSNINTAEIINIGEFNNVFIEKCRQNFIVPSNKTTLITGKRGLKVTVNPAMLEKENGASVDGDIAVRLLEFINTEELFKGNTATTSDGRLLSSGGCYFIGMECNGTKVRVKNGKHLQIQIPEFRKEPMELFYGQRDNISGNMNWVRASMPLVEETPISFNEGNGIYTADYFPFAEPLYNIDTQRIYKSLNEEVYYYDKKMTIRALVDTINRYSAKIYIDTVYTWPKQPAILPKGARIDTAYLYHVYGPPKQFRLKNCKMIELEAAYLAKAATQKQQAITAWKPKTIANQLQKYYCPSNITYLGWINCDRFYYYPGAPVDVPLDLPYTFRHSDIKYFLLFRSLNGMINGAIPMNRTSSPSLGKLPVGTETIFIAFTKNNGNIYHCKKEFTVQKDNPVKIDFTYITHDEMTGIFGSNIKM